MKNTLGINMNTQVFAHRGASGYAPENTIEAIELANNLGAHGIEIDVQLTRDNLLVVCHDERIDRVSNGIGRIADMRYSELKNSNSIEPILNMLMPSFQLSKRYLNL